MILSILIRTLPNRVESFNYIYNKVKSQIEILGQQDNVEILFDCTPKGELSSGEKANILLRRAKGKYIIFIDDDDDVEEHYVLELLVAAGSDKDCFAMCGFMTTDGRGKIEWRLSKDYENITIKEGGVEVYLRKTNHITAVKRELALKAGFADKSNAEDKAYSEALNPHLKTEHKIMKPMYHYKYSTQNKEY